MLGKSLNIIQCAYFWRLILVCGICYLACPIHFDEEIPYEFTNFTIESRQIYDASNFSILYIQILWQFFKLFWLSIIG